MTSIGLISLPQLIAALFLFSLTFVSLIAGYRERLWRTFALFAGLLGLAATCAFAATTVKNPDLALLLIKLAPCLGIASFSISLYYIAILTDMDFDKIIFGKRIRFYVTEDSYSLILFDRAVKFRYHVMLSMLFFGVVFYFIAFTDLFMGHVNFKSNPVEVEFGPLVFVVLAMVGISGFKSFFFLNQAKKRFPESPRRKLIKTNIIGFELIYLPALVFVVGQHFTGKAVAPWFYLWIALSVTVFYLGIIRYKFESVEELNRDLEKKVDERTRHLQQTQVKLAQAERMGTLGKLVAGVAHEINNPLGSVTSSHDTIFKALEKLDLESRVGENGQQKYVRILKDSNRVMDEGLDRIKNVVSRLKSFARLDESNKQRTQIEKDLETTLGITHIPDNITVEKFLDSLPPLYCNPATLNQVWSNLLLNAVQAIQMAGREQGIIKITANKEKDSIQICISDNGCGIPEPSLKSIFEPGFTTKGVGVGTGLGLSICYEIVREHGGSIAVTSTLGQGSSLTVHLPLAALPVTA